MPKYNKKVSDQSIYIPLKYVDSSRTPHVRWDFRVARPLSSRLPALEWGYSVAKKLVQFCTKSIFNLYSYRMPSAYPRYGKGKYKKRVVSDHFTYYYVSGYLEVSPALSRNALLKLYDFEFLQPATLQWPKCWTCHTLDKVRKHSDNYQRGPWQFGAAPNQVHPNQVHTSPYWKSKHSSPITPRRSVAERGFSHKRFHNLENVRKSLSFAPSHVEVRNTLAADFAPALPEFSQFNRMSSSGYFY